jgi:hypothetical protein
MKLAGFILTVLLAMPTLSWAKTKTVNGDCNLNSSCEKPPSAALNLNDSSTPIPGLPNLAMGIKAAQPTQTAAAITESYVSSTDTQPLTIAPTLPPVSSDEDNSSNHNSGEKER